MDGIGAIEVTGAIGLLTGIDAVDAFIVLIAPFEALVLKPWRSNKVDAAGVNEKVLAGAVAITGTAVGTNVQPCACIKTLREPCLCCLLGLPPLH